MTHPPPSLKTFPLNNRMSVYGARHFERYIWFLKWTILMAATTTTATTLRPKIVRLIFVFVFFCKIHSDILCIDLKNILCLFLEIGKTETELGRWRRRAVAAVWPDFGKISTLWQNGKSIWHLFRLLNIWQNVEHTLTNCSCYWRFFIVANVISN